MSHSVFLPSGPDEVIAVLLDVRRALRGFGVRRIGLFGSFARGEQTPDSDLDFLVELERSDFRDFMDLAFYLEDRFGRRVELITKGNLSPYIAPAVEHDVRWCET
jgi:predicted nucleotidyltransferase